MGRQEDEIRKVIQAHFMVRPPRPVGEASMPITWQEIVNLVSHQTTGQKEDMYMLSPHVGEILFWNIHEVAEKGHDDVSVEAVVQGKGSGHSYFIIGSVYEHANPVYVRAVRGRGQNGVPEQRISFISIARNPYMAQADGVREARPRVPSKPR
jgi:hypothetical protein